MEEEKNPKIEPDTGTAQETEASKKKKRSAVLERLIRYIALAVAACTFTYAAYSLTKTYLEYKEGDDVYENVKDMFLQEVEEEQEQEKGGEQVAVANKEKKWVFDFAKLEAINPDARGYIKQDNSRINYPIMQGTDNAYYLSYTFDRTYNRNGSIFVDCAIKEGLNARNSVIYGHNMWSDSMFGTLVEYQKKEYLEKNPTFDVYIGNKHYIYYVFASFECEAEGDSVYQHQFATDEEFVQWQQKQRARSYYTVDTVPELTAEDQILTLSTCTTRDDKSKRVIVMCVRGEQVID